MSSKSLDLCFGKVKTIEKSKYKRLAKYILKSLLIIDNSFMSYAIFLIYIIL